MKKRFENFTGSILRINKLVHKIKTVTVKKYGLKTIHVMCLHYLNQSPEGLSEVELVKLTLEDKAAISRAVAQLQEEGYVTFDKGYNTTITLTPVGRAMADYIDEQAVRAVRASGMDFTDEERDHFYQSLNAIGDKLETYYDFLETEDYPPSSEEELD
jgi:DNA-binding MarR family transcriptional regulator